MFDITIIQDLYIPLVILACLIVGFIIKKWVKDVDNKFIPTVLAILGAVLGCVALNEISLSAMIGGAASGLVSTGLHQAFKQLIGE